MKTFIFESISLLSRQDQRAKGVTFHPKKNLVLGRNHTGKSSLIKALFLTLGARPQGNLERWDPNTASEVAFTVDSHKYRVTHQRGYRALFDGEDNLVLATGSHDKWSEAFSKAIGFNLVLTDRKMRTVSADARCFFLPFYINQDGSWQATWNTFAGLQQYRSPAAPVLEYFSGVKPPEYYEVSSERLRMQGRLEELQKELDLLKRARARLENSMKAFGPKVDPKDFAREIDRLTQEVSHLNRRQELLRDASVREGELLSSIHLQIQLAEDALRAYESDSSYLRGDEAKNLECPTCGAEHARSFIELLAYAEDARVLRELALELQQDENKAAEQYARTKEQLRELDSNYQRVSAILETRRGDMKFGDIVESMGSESAFRAFEEEIDSLEKQIDSCLKTIGRLTLRLKQLSNKKRSKEIVSLFRSAYHDALASLNLPYVDTSRLRLTSRPNLSGSGGPRSVLAYYSALWQTCLSEYGSFSVPLVIDAPQQQGQDQINLPKILKFIATELPASSQIVLGSEMDTGQHFDKRIPLDRPYKLLDETEFDKISQTLNPRLERMQSALRRRRHLLL